MAVKEAAEQLKAQLQPQIDLLNQIESDYDADMAAADQKAKDEYSRGYGDGKASVVLPDPNDPAKILSQAEGDQIAATARAETESKMQPQIDAAVAASADLQSKVDAGVSAQADLQAKLDAEKAKSADLQAKLDGDEAKISQAKADLG